MNFKSLAKRFRVQFSLKFLIVLPVLVVIYFSYGPSTRTKGMTDVMKRVGGDYTYMRTLAPLLIESRKITAEFQETTRKPIFCCRTTYFIWFHGLVVRAPFTREQVRDIPTGGFTAKEMVSEWGPLPGY